LIHTGKIITQTKKRKWLFSFAITLAANIPYIVILVKGSNTLLLVSLIISLVIGSYYLVKDYVQNKHTVLIYEKGVVINGEWYLMNEIDTYKEMEDGVNIIKKGKEIVQFKIESTIQVINGFEKIEKKNIALYAYNNKKDERPYRLNQYRSILENSEIEKESIEILRIFGEEAQERYLQSKMHVEISLEKENNYKKKLDDAGYNVTLENGKWIIQLKDKNGIKYYAYSREDLFEKMRDIINVINKEEISI
jgi:hypothetical protein